MATVGWVTGNIQISFLFGLMIYPTNFKRKWLTFIYITTTLSFPHAATAPGPVWKKKIRYEIQNNFDIFFHMVLIWILFFLHRWHSSDLASAFKHKAYKKKFCVYGIPTLPPFLAATLIFFPGFREKNCIFTKNRQFLR